MAYDETFEEGDEVVFETNEYGDNPRWDFETDQGGGGRIVSGIVMEVADEIITVSCEEIGSENWQWPLSGHLKYDKNQWDRPGYLRKPEWNKKKERFSLVDMGGYYSLQKIA